jgi:DNA polymerase III epsilon subunit-like protein
MNEIEWSNIIEIGAVKLSGKDLTVKDTFSELIRPRDFPILSFITEITGITPEMVEECDEFASVARRFIRWYGPRNRSILAAFGTYYDIPLLRKEFRVFGLDFATHCVGGALDIRSLALAWLAERKRSTTGITLDGVLEKMEVGDLGLSFHRALDDAKAATAILQMVHFGKVALQSQP